MASPELQLAEPGILGFDIGGTNTRIIGEHGGTPLVWPTEQDYSEQLNRIVSRCDLLFAPVEAAGIAIAGEVEDGSLVRAGELATNGWLGRDIQGDLAERLNLDRDKVVLVNDCVAAAIAQQQHERVRSIYPNNGLVVTYSTGHGGAYFENKAGGDSIIVPLEPGHARLWGEAPCGCGEIGHTESYIGGASLKQRLGREPEELEEWQWRSRVVPYMAAGLTQLLHSLEDGEQTDFPETVHYFGSLATQQACVIPTLERILRSYTLTPDPLLNTVPIIRPADYGDNGGIRGAILAAKQILEGEPIYDLESNDYAAAQDQVAVVNHG